MCGLIDSLARHPEFLVAIVSTLVCGAVAITYLIARHRERMAKIEQGLDPDRKSRRWDSL